MLEHAARQRDGSATPLHAAAPRNVRAPLDVARLLLAHGARADERNREDRAALHYAAWDGHVDLARTLLDRGADASARDARGITPL